MENHINKSEERMDARLEKIEKLFEKQQDKLDSVSVYVGNKIDENKKIMLGITITIIVSIIASVGVIISTYFSTISLIKSMM